jgi:hypothetical protein
VKKGFAGREDEVVEGAALVEKRLHARLVGKVYRVALATGRQGLQGAFDPRLAARNDNYLGTFGGGRLGSG